MGVTTEGRNKEEDLRELASLFAFFEELFYAWRLVEHRENYYLEISAERDFIERMGIQEKLARCGINVILHSSIKWEQRYGGVYCFLDVPHHLIGLVEFWRGRKYAEEFRREVET